MASLAKCLSVWRCKRVQAILLAFDNATMSPRFPWNTYFSPFPSTRFFFFSSVFFTDTRRPPKAGPDMIASDETINASVYQVLRNYDRVTFPGLGAQKCLIRRFWQVHECLLMFQWQMFRNLFVLSGTVNRLILTISKVILLLRL